VSGERIRLWFSYQRYAILIVALVALAVGVLFYLGAAGMLAAPLAIYPIGKSLAFAREIASNLPRKLRITQLASARIASGRFTASRVTTYCGDPCFRVVANEILRRAGLPRQQRRTLIRQFAREQRRRGGQVLVLVDRERGVRLEIDGIDVQQFSSGGTR
jgi:hypothetical protein